MRGGGAQARIYRVCRFSDEAPRIMLDPAADNTDVIALPAHEGPGKLTAATNWVPLESPAGGAYFGKLDVA
ncbi:DUF4331 family protein [Kribbella sp. NPDC049174]|uniref:DUF4331 family protein n=1 Tax=Kribbella sp. NPDC049174 TaxID=3364112 RepID=UPI003718697B